LGGASACVGAACRKDVLLKKQHAADAEQRAKQAGQT
jgi:hypothetical protein